VSGTEALITVRVRPRSRPGLTLLGDAIVVRVAAAPAGGAATDEARRALARALGVAPSAVTLRMGTRRREKTFAVAGLTREEATVRLRRAAGRP